MRPLLLLLVLTLTLRAADPFEIREGDRVLLLGDTLLERENTYGYLETRMHEQFPDRKFTVRNLSWAGDTPRGVSRASFDPPAKGWERLKDSIAEVKPTVVFLGYGMAASLQEMTDRAQDPTLNRDETRYGSEPMSAARFKKELGELMDAIEKGATQPGGLKDISPGQRPGSPVEKGTRPEGAQEPAKGSPAPAGADAGVDGKPRVSPGANVLQPSGLPGAVRFVLLSPIRHEDLRAVKPGHPDPAPHNALLEAYSKAIDELAKEKGARFVNLFKRLTELDNTERGMLPTVPVQELIMSPYLTDNGIHLSGAFCWHEETWKVENHERRAFVGSGADLGAALIAMDLWDSFGSTTNQPLRAAVLKKNELFFHRFRPENATYLFGFRKHEQGQNAKEIPMFDPLIEQAEAEIDRLKKAGKPAADAGARPDGSVALQRESSVQVSVPLVEVSGKLAEVSNKLVQVSDKLPQVSGGLVQLSEPVAEVSQGVAQLSQGVPQLSQGVVQVSQPVVQLSQGVPQLSKKVPQLSQGVAQLSQPDATLNHTVVTQATRPTPTAAPTPPPLPDFTVLEGYQIALWAENPLLEKPTQMNWDALGRLWVCSSSLYPQIEPGQAANDKILILEDTDRDGKADRSTVFADGLLIPTAVVPDLRSEGGREGLGEGEKAPTAKSPTLPLPPSPTLSLTPSACYVGQSTELLHLSDTDGDGKADTRRVVFSGFGTEDTHHLIHTLKWGPDGRLYWNQSIYIHSHLETPHGMVRLNSGGIFAYDPRTERVEVMAKGWCNPWGHAWDQFGQSFVTDGAGGNGISWAIPGAMYFTYENGRKIAPSVSPGSYPKFCGLEIIHSPHFPADWQGNAVTNDFRAHRIVRVSIQDLSITTENTEGTEKGKTPPASPSVPSVSSVVKSGYVTKEMPDLVRTSDQSFRPIDIRLGPDGALYVADWSNPVINHGEVDFRDPRRDKHMGRIWRISKKDAPVVKWEPLVGKTTTELLGGLVSKNSWEQEGARRVLSERSATDPDWSSTEARTLEAVWNAIRRPSTDMNQRHTTLEMVERLVVSKDARFRALAVRLKPRVFSSFATIHNETQAKAEAEAAAELKELEELIKSNDQAKIERAEKMLDTMVCTFGPIKITPATHSRVLASFAADANPRVRLEAMRSLSNIPTPESAALVLEAALNAPKDDALYDYAAWLSINDLAKPWTEAIASGAWKADTEARGQQLAWGLKNIDPALAGATLSRLMSENKVPIDGSGPWIELLGSAGGAKEIDRLWTRVQEQKSETLKIPRILTALGDAAKLRGVRPTVPVAGLADYLDTGHAETVRAAARLAGAWKYEAAVPRLVVMTTGKDDASRNTAFEALREIGSEPARVALRTLAAAPNAPHIRGQAVAALAALDFNPALIAEALAAQPDEAAALPVWRGLLAVKGASDRLAASLPKEMPKPVALAGLRAAREAGKNGAKLLAALTPLAGVSDAEAKMPKDFKALAGFAKQNGDPARGEMIYRRAALGCTTCHAIGGAGGKVGPDMTSIGASAPLDYIIESTLAPALKVKEGYNAATFTLKDGTQATGVQVRETAQEIFVRDVTGRETAVAKGQIAGTTNIGSIMPAGLVDTLADRERLDLFAFLGELGKPGPYDASKGTVARVWRLFPGADADKVIGGTALLESGFPGYTLVDGRFVKDLLAAVAPLAANGDTMMCVTQFQSSGGKTRLKLTGAGKVWLDGKPLALTEDLAPELTAGVHTLAVRLDVKTLPAVLRAESPDARFLGN